MRKYLAFTFCLGFGALCLEAQQETQRFSFDLGGGFTEPVGNTGRYLDPGWNVQGGGGVNLSSYFGVMIDLNYNSMGINNTTLSNFGFPGGGVHVFSATLDPVVHLNPHGRFDIYLTGGGGIFHHNQDFTAPSVATFTSFNPFFGGFFPIAVPTTEILSSYTVNKPGVDIGAGIALGSKWHGKFFAEARYDRIFMGNHFHTDYVPVSFGFRW
jgi:Outer membrane protein beta-barrel domain